MGLFDKKEKKEREEKIKEREREMILRTYAKRTIPSAARKIPTITTREYRIFRRKEKRKKTWYETLVNISENFVRISPGKKMEEDIKRVIAFTDMKITPEGVMGLLVTTIMFFAVIGIVAIITGIVPAIGGLMVIVLGALIGYYLIQYPKNVLKSMRIQASSQIVLAVLYMVVSMRISPNLERALRFAAANTSGPLAWDMRKLLWDIEMRKYYSAEDALDAYIEKWKPENEEFAEALRMIRDSQSQAPQRAMQELDEALNLILTGTKTRMKHYSQDLRMPVMVIHMMGIVLPMLGTIMAPLAAVFMADLVQPWHFILGYDIILPIVIIWFINTTLRKRPVTVPEVDISRHPDVPPKGRFFIGKTAVPVLPFAALVLILFLALPIGFFMQHPDYLMSGMANRNVSVNSLLMSTMIILGIGISLAVYFILSNYQRISIQTNIEKTEGEFEIALFQLGNRIAGGTPTEVAVEKSIGDMKDLEIAGMFKIILRNIRNLGLTFEQALFDPTWGALKFYPSKLIRNIMYTVVDTAKKGTSYASEGMLRIAKYLKNIRETQEYIRDMLSETSSSMKFQAYFLTPLITGLIVSMSDVIVQVLSKLGQYLEGMGFGQQLGLPDVSAAFGNMEASVSPELFQLIVGIYLIEVVIILGMFLTKIGSGENRSLMWLSTGKMLLISVIVYFLVAIMASSMFGELIRSALSSLGIAG